jgi:hypothetical protein
MIIRAGLEPAGNGIEVLPWIGKSLTRAYGKPRFAYPCISPACISIDKYMLSEVYDDDGICVRNHCGAKPPRDIEPPGLVTTVGWRDRAPASYVAARRVQAPASAARGWFRGIDRGRTAPSLPAEGGTASGGRCLARPIPSLLVRSCRCSRTPPRTHGSIHTNENQHPEKTTRPDRERDIGEKE